jgi:hypothetical protein
LIHIPAVHAPEKLREVYNEVCRTCGYENFTRIQGGARIERRDAEREGFSQLTLVGDRIQLTEDHTGVSVEQFGKKIVAALEAALPVLQIPILLVQQNTVRITAVPNSFRTAAEFLARNVFRVQPENFEVFGRPTSVFGFRLVFPQAAQHPQGHNVRIECYVRDPRALYIENVATFRTPIQAATLDLVEKNLKMTSDFLVDNVVKFLSLYDRRENE